MSELKVGDVVELKSGGPKMTVKELAIFGLGSSKVKANCTWFEGGKLTEEVFEIETLNKK